MRALDNSGRASKQAFQDRPAGTGPVPDAHQAA